MPISWLHHKPHAIAVYASWPALPSAHATLATRRPATALPGPVFHRLDCTSFCWRLRKSRLAKQQCSAATPSPHGFWSWRLIDGRKCWYEGKPGLSKSLLKWPAQAPVQPASDGELASTPTERPSNPLDSQAWAPTDSDTFEALWRARVEQH